MGARNNAPKRTSQGHQSSHQVGLLNHQWAIKIDGERQRVWRGISMVDMVDTVDSPSQPLIFKSQKKLKK